MSEKFRMRPRCHNAIAPFRVQQSQWIYWWSETKWKDFSYLITCNRWRHQNEPISCYACCSRSWKFTVHSDWWSSGSMAEHQRKTKEKKIVIALMKSSTDDCLAERERHRAVDGGHTNEREIKSRGYSVQLNRKWKKTYYTLSWWMWCDVNVEPVARRPHQ